MEAGGTYVLVCTGIDLTELQRTNAIKHIVRAFKRCGYTGPKIEVISQNQLIGLLQPFPSLSLEMNDNAGLSFETHRRWADHDQMRLAFKPGKQHTALIRDLRERLRKHEAAVHVHVVGEPGIGKTRLVLEALRKDDLSPLVIYCDRPSKIFDSELLSAILRDDNPFSLILVVDECDSETRSILWNKLKYAGPRLKLVTIYSEFDTTTGNIEYFTAPPLEEEQIIEILREYLPAAENAKRWAGFCSGSPRVAHVVGLNLRNNSEDLMRSPDTVNIWERFVAGEDKAEHPEVKQRTVVLRRLALFKRFGFGPPMIAEAKAIAELCNQDDRSITWAIFKEIVLTLKERKILQGENTLYITPKLLHIKLWADWWNIHGDDFVLENFVKEVPHQLFDWFMEMVIYAEQSQAAQKVVRSLLDEDGPFQTSSLLRDPRGARFFLSLTEAAPTVALQSLNNTVGTWTRDELLEFTTGRQEVVWALERMAVWRELFPQAARLLLKLAEAENEYLIDNNATGVFAGLFSHGQGPTAPTEAPPEERYPVLKEALEHSSKNCRKVALACCDHALKYQYITRMVGAEHQGLRRQPKLWMPKTWGELFDAYRRVWHLLSQRLEHMPQDERPDALNVLLNNSRDLTQVPNLAGMVTETLAELLTKPWVDKREVIEVVEAVLHYDAKDFGPEMRDAWMQLHKLAVSDDFHSQLRRYVGMNIIEDKFDEEGRHTDKAQPRIESLAQQALARPDLLGPELDWLTTDDAKNGDSFGYRLGVHDKGFSLLPKLLESQRNATKNPNVFFLGGYLQALHEEDSNSWEYLMDSLVADSSLGSHIPELTWRNGLSDRAAIRLLTLAEEGRVPATSFRIFSDGGVIRRLSAERFTEWIEFLLGTGARPEAVCAIELCHFYYLIEVPKLELPKDLTFRVLTAPPLFIPSENSPPARYVDHDWTKVARAYIDQHPERSLELAGLMLEHFREAGTIVGAFRSATNKVLHDILKRSPVELWTRIARYLGPSIDSRAFHISNWLREDAVALIPAQAVWNWVDQDIENRAWYVAQFVPQDFPGDSSRVSVREVLVRYGQRNEVRRYLMDNFSPKIWRGPESVHLQEKLDQLKSWKAGESEANVLRWLNEYSAVLGQRMEGAKIAEERDLN